MSNFTALQNFESKLLNVIMTFAASSIFAIQYEGGGEIHLTSRETAYDNALARFLTLCISNEHVYFD